MNRIMLIGVEQNYDSISGFDWVFFYRRYGEVREVEPEPTYEAAIERMNEFIANEFSNSNKVEG